MSYFLETFRLYTVKTLFVPFLKKSTHRHSTTELLKKNIAQVGFLLESQSLYISQLKIRLCQP